MGRLIDADVLSKEFDRRCSGDCCNCEEDTNTESGCKIIDEAPTVDAVPVVRCKDCKWWDKVDNIDGVNYGTCERKCTAIRKDAFPNENWFCADGERREE